MSKHYSQGFSLIELLIVIAIIGILATVGTTFYGEYVIKAKRTPAREALLDTAAILERCKGLYGSYNSGNCSISDGDIIPSSGNLYNVSVTTAPVTYTLTASPMAASSQSRDTKCTSFILNYLGQQTATGTDPTSCW